MFLCGFFLNLKLKNLTEKVDHTSMSLLHVLLYTRAIPKSLFLGIEFCLVLLLRTAQTSFSKTHAGAG